MSFFAKEWEKKAEASLNCMDGCRKGQSGAAGKMEFCKLMKVADSSGSGSFDRVFHSPSIQRRFLESRWEIIRAFLNKRRFGARLLAYPWSLAFLCDILNGTEGQAHFLENDLVLKQFRQAALDQDNPVRQALKCLRHRRTLSNYHSRMSRVSWFVGISKQEAEVTAALFPGFDTGRVSYGIRFDEHPILAVPSNKNGVGFISNYRHVLSLEALQWLHDAIFPVAWVKWPDFRFLYVCRGVPAAIRTNSSRESSVKILENVPGLKIFYCLSAVYLNPVRTGRESKSEVKKVAAFGGPIVRASLWTEGLEVSEFWISDAAETMAEVESP